MSGWSVGGKVGWLLGLSYFLKGREVLLPCSHRSICFLKIQKSPRPIETLMNIIDSLSMINIKQKKHKYNRLVVLEGLTINLILGTGRNM